SQHSKKSRRSISESAPLQESSVIPGGESILPPRENDRRRGRSPARRTSPPSGGRRGLCVGRLASSHAETAATPGPELGVPGLRGRKRSRTHILLVLRRRNFTSQP